MCGRYSLTTPAESVRRLFDYEARPNLEPRYNIAPTDEVPVVRLARDGGARELVMMRWGLVPWWAKDIKIGAKTINARAETVARKPAFRDAFRERRCLVAADGFYEWRKEGKLLRPFRITRRDHEPFAFAGLWERFTPPEGAAIVSFTIITTEANVLLRPLHGRMPVIVGADDHGAWLHPEAGAPDLQALLRPFPDDQLSFFEVSPRVNKVANDDASLIEPVADPRLL
jgi:putative SOS response-associated peptidase YedK